MASSQQSDEQADHEMEELSFRDAEDYVERRRQKEVLDAVQFVSETHNATESEYERGQIELDTRRAEVRMAVNNLIMETEQLIRKSGDASVLEQEQIAQVTIGPPQDLVEFANRSGTQIWGEASLGPRAVYTVRGLMGYLNAPTNFSDTWSLRADVPGEGPQKLTSTVTVRMPVDISMQVFRVIRRFLADVDLDLGAELNPYTGGDGPGI